MGTMADRLLAEKLGVSLPAVISRRSQRGIIGANPRRAWTASEETLLGTMPDSQLAGKLSRTELGVAIRRRELQIPVLRRK